MKTKTFTLIASVVLLASSCSKEVYNNKHYLAQHNLEGKTLAILPVEVYYTGNKPKNSDWYAEEQAISLQIQTALEQAYLLHAGEHKPGKHQFNIKLMDVNTVNKKLLQNMTDLRTAWKMPADSVGRMIDADIVFKLHMNKERYMSKNLAKSINTGAFFLESLLNTSDKGGDFVALPRVQAEDVGYEISLIDAHSGEVISSYVKDPEKDRSKKVRKINKTMVAKSVVFAANYR
ncbi:hypothetical protein [Mucilaginibacter segetis]|uniref:Lipoprotein n=1 Tax=Mucilaginibacter segetis TaxID=2793071 RepID=A0A934UNV2_9SPHI|nr:hypothetical protein [Mucilaginibacter segetis]MBK0380286.1 hypothetical protein [Mucilaginibacter segetis]